jgi:hypothetical protein
MSEIFSCRSAVRTLAVKRAGVPTWSRRRSTTVGVRPLIAWTSGL